MFSVLNQFRMELRERFVVGYCLGRSITVTGRDYEFSETACH